MKIILTADWHLTDRVQDEYRFDFVSWLREYARMEKVERILILGDLTESKDGHCSSLVNRIVEELVCLSKISKLSVLMGNHDYVDEKQPFFGFLSHVPGIQFVSSVAEDPQINALYLPNKKGWYDKANYLSLAYLRQYDYIFCHQCFTGAKAANNSVLVGVSAECFNDLPQTMVFAGDIHVPQVVGKVRYVGAPYRITYGDSYSGQIIVLDTQSKEQTVVAVPSTVVKKTVTISSINELRQNLFLPENRVKLVVRLDASQAKDWLDLRELAVEFFETKTQAVLDSVELQLVGERSIKQQNQSEVGFLPEDILCQYAKQNSIDKQLLEVGKELVRC